MTGINAYGAYIPRARLQKSVIAEANQWFDAGLASLASGERAMCNWDEDSITMAVEAGRDCLSLLDPRTVGTLYLASTTLPFSDRQNSVVVSDALNLDRHLRALDVGASQRCATSALIALLDATGPRNGNALLIAAEHRRSRAGSHQEMLWGDAAAAVGVGQDGVIAEYLGSTSYADNFVDHYRGEGETIDYEWEERWVRDEGFMRAIPEVVGTLLKTAGVTAAEVTHFVLPSDQPRTPAAVAKRLGIRPESVVDNLIGRCGIAGAAHPLLLLTAALEAAQPGDLILVTAFGQGADAILLRATDQITARRPGVGITGTLERRREERNYQRFLSFNDLVEREIGKRGETDKQTYLAAMYRRDALLTRFIGGQCRQCGTVQIPKERYCVNPACRALDSQDDYPLAGVPGHIKTWTADRLTFDWNPPAYFGMVEFAGGARMMMDFTEVEGDAIESGVAVTTHFRIKQFDPQRGFRKYFWKAIPG